MNTKKLTARLIRPQTALRATALLTLFALSPAGFANSQPTRSDRDDAPPFTQMSAAVKVSDLDLTTESGIRTANERIRVAAENACNFTTNMGDYVVGAREVYQKCLKQTVSNAALQLEHARLVALRHRGARVAAN